MSWCTIESDPGVFTALIEDIGVKNVQVEELYTLDRSDFERIAPVYGLVFLFKWNPNHQYSTVSTGKKAEADSGLFFAKQVINNACATQAILSILLNSPQLEIGATLTEFKSFVSEFPPELKGLAISNSDKIRTAHNSFARAEPFVMEEAGATEKDDVYHFVAYVPFNGKLYELDGLKDAPTVLGEGEDWLDYVRPAIQERIDRYSSSEIRFNLLALVKNRRVVYKERLASLEKRLTRIEGKETGIAEDDIEFEVAARANERAQQKRETVTEIEDLRRNIQSEEEKFSNWKLENARRKHNYIPFIVMLLKQLAKQNQLRPLIEKQLAKSNE